MKTFYLTLALSATAAVFAEDLANCGATPYYRSQYTCFNNNFLCPLSDSLPSLQCGTACYLQYQYACSNNQLVINDANQPNLYSCGSARYNPNQYVCFDGNFLCPVIQGNPTLRCGDACYNYTQYRCENGQLVLNPPPTCKTEYDYCFKDGMSFACCPGLICVANRCRDPCQLRPEACAK